MVRGPSPSRQYAPSASRQLRWYYRQLAERPDGYPRIARKRCVGCGIEKSGEDFYRRATLTTGVTPRCKACTLASTRHRKYGVKEIGTACEICGSIADLVADHEPGVGFRGTLCRWHNAGLGHFGHDPEMLQMGIAYLMSPRP